MPCLDGKIVEYARDDGRLKLTVDEIRTRLLARKKRRRRKTGPRPTCQQGHPMTEANVLIEKNGARRCLMCRTNSLQQRLRRHHKPRPSETGVCQRGLHAWVEENWVIDKNGAMRCRPCRQKAQKEIYARNSRIPCVVKNCPRATHRGDGNYICKQHRANPPGWIARAGLRISGTRLIPV